MNEESCCIKEEYAPPEEPIRVLVKEFLKANEDIIYGPIGVDTNTVISSSPVTNTITISDEIDHCPTQLATKDEVESVKNDIFNIYNRLCDIESLLVGNCGPRSVNPGMTSGTIVSQVNSIRTDLERIKNTFNGGF